MGTEWAVEQTRGRRLWQEEEHGSEAVWEPCTTERGADGLTTDCWAPGVFYWRKGKAGHAVDSASGLFLWEPPEAAILPSAQQPCWLAALHGLASQMPCDTKTQRGDFSVCSLSS